MIKQQDTPMSSSSDSDLVHWMISSSNPIRPEGGVGCGIPIPAATFINVTTLRDNISGEACKKEFYEVLPVRPDDGSAGA